MIHSHSHVFMPSAYLMVNLDAGELTFPQR